MEIESVKYDHGQKYTHFKPMSDTISSANKRIMAEANQELLSNFDQ